MIIAQNKTKKPNKMPNITDCRVLCRILLGICYPEMRKQHKHTTNRTRTHTMTTNKMK